MTEITPGTQGGPMSEPSEQNELTHGNKWQQLSDTLFVPPQESDQDRYLIVDDGQLYDRAVIPEIG